MKTQKIAFYARWDDDDEDFSNPDVNLYLRRSDARKNQEFSWVCREDFEKVLGRKLKSGEVIKLELKEVK